MRQRHLWDSFIRKNTLRDRTELTWCSVHAYHRFIAVKHNFTKIYKQFLSALVTQQQVAIVIPSIDSIEAICLPPIIRARGGSSTVAIPLGERHKNMQRLVAPRSLGGCSLTRKQNGFRWFFRYTDVLA
jgi:hypothetical protein